MATRSMVQFGYKDDPQGFTDIAQIYHHYDGYPENRLKDIHNAIRLAHENYRETAGFSYRIGNTYPSDLAGFYVLANKEGAGNVEVDQSEHGDLDYIYKVYQKDGTFHVIIDDLSGEPVEGTLKELMDKYSVKPEFTKQQRKKLATESLGDVITAMKTLEEDMEIPQIKSFAKTMQEALTAIKTSWEE